MSFVELLLVAVGLSMDAFAVSVCKGLSVKKLGVKHALIAGAYFGGFQFLMPVIGWFLGSRFEHIITSFDHWIAFGLLAIIGVNMIQESFSKAEELNDDFGVKTFCLSVLGIYIGHIFGLRFKAWAERAGGAILILIGVKILLEHLGIISF